jgi:hypothetical protein
LGSFWQKRTVSEANRFAPIKLGSFWQKRTAPRLTPAPFVLIELGSFWQKAVVASHSDLLT